MSFTGMCYQSRPPIIDGLLYPGTYLFAGAPKVGKSFLMAQLAYHVSMGLPLWGYPVHKGTVLSSGVGGRPPPLAGAAVSDVRHGRQLTTCSLRSTPKQLGLGLEEQLKKFCPPTPDTKLIIIDTSRKSGRSAGTSTAMPTITRWWQAETPCR
ncbi:MAG: AAA family ATPase [Oscillospiraceae bacterium]